MTEKRQLMATIRFASSEIGKVMILESRADVARRAMVLEVGRRAFGIARNGKRFNVGLFHENGWKLQIV